MSRHPHQTGRQAGARPLTEASKAMDEIEFEHTALTYRQKLLVTTSHLRPWEPPWPAKASALDTSTRQSEHSQSNAFHWGKEWFLP
jgi:hypothetical protein